VKTALLRLMVGQTSSTCDKGSPHPRMRKARLMAANNKPRLRRNILTSEYLVRSDELHQHYLSLVLSHRYNTMASISRTLRPLVRASPRTLRPSIRATPQYVSIPRRRKTKTDEEATEYDVSQRLPADVKLSISRMSRRHPSLTSPRPRCS
jgi:hypothetical protein